MYKSKYIDRLEKDVLRLEEQNKELMTLLKERHLLEKKKISGRGAIGKNNEKGNGKMIQCPHCKEAKG